MATAFTGVSTGRVYNAGQLYANGNGLYRANADGSFSNLSTGRTAVGSYGSDRAVFFNTRSAAPVRSGGGVGNARVVSGGKAGTGPGVEAVVSAAAGGTGPGVPVVKKAARGGAFLDPGALSGLRRESLMSATGAPEKITEIYIDGWRYPRNPRTSDAGEIEESLGEAEFPGIAWAVTQAAQVDNLWYASPYKPAVDAWAERERARIARGEGNGTHYGAFSEPPLAMPYGTAEDPYGFSNPRFGQ